LIAHLSHATNYAEFACGLRERFRGPGRDSALAELGSEIGNLRVAWRHWVDQGDLELIDEAIALGRASSGPLPWLAVSRVDVMRLLPEPDLDRVERLYEETMETAHTMRLAMVEIQATTRLVGLRQELGVVPDGSIQLARLYATFESGHDEPDLVAASELVEGTRTA